MMIDRALEQKPADFDALLKLLSEMGCEVSRRGKVIRLKAPGWKNVARMDDKLGDGYSEAEIRAVLAGKKQHTPRKKSTIQPEPPKVNLLVDIQAKLQAGKGAGYARWAKVFNLKQMAQTMNFLTEHNLLDYAELAEKAAAATTPPQRAVCKNQGNGKTHGGDCCAADPYHQLCQDPRDLCSLSKGRLLQEIPPGT